MHPSHCPQLLCCTGGISYKVRERQAPKGLPGPRNKPCFTSRVTGEATTCTLGLSLITKQPQVKLGGTQVGMQRLRMRRPCHTSALPSRAPREPRGAEAVEDEDKDWRFFFSMRIGKVRPFYPDCEAWKMKDSSQTSKTTIYRIKKIFLLCLSCTLFT